MFSLNRQSHTVFLAVALLLGGAALFQAGSLRAAWRLNMVNVTLAPLWQAETAFGCQEPSRLTAVDQETLPDTVSDNPQLLIQNGRLQWLAGHCQEAAAQWEQAFALSPGNPVAGFLTASGHYALGETETAVAAYRQINAADYLHQMAQSMQADIPLADIVDWYALSFAVTPDPQLGNQLADVYLSLHQPEKAQAMLAQTLQMTGEQEAEHWWAKGALAEMDDQPETAVAAYDRGAALAADRYPYYWRIATLCFQRQDYACAHEYYQLASADKPLRIRPLLALGDVAQAQGEDDAAWRYYRQANEVYAPSELPELYQGILLWEQGRAAEAEIILLEANRQNPQNAEVLYYLGLIAYDRGAFADAMSYLEQATAMRVRPPGSWLLLLSQWYVENGRCQALQNIYPSLSTSGISPDALLTLDQSIAETCPPQP